MEAWIRIMVMTCFIYSTKASDYSDHVWVSELNYNEKKSPRQIGLQINEKAYVKYIMKELSFLVKFQF